jgi:hypothetical protein
MGAKRVSDICITLGWLNVNLYNKLWNVAGLCNKYYLSYIVTAFSIFLFRNIVICNFLRANIFLGSMATC